MVWRVNDDTPVIAGVPYETIRAARHDYVPAVLLNADDREEELVGMHSPRDQGGRKDGY
jgi:hypothetical protein